MVAGRLPRLPSGGDAAYYFAHMIRSTWSIVLLLLALASGCHRTPAVTTDRSTPQAAVMSFMHAIDQRDSSAVTEAFAATTPAEQAYATALTDLLSASSDLKKEAVRKFGSEDAKQLIGDAGPGDDDFQRIKHASVAINGNRATLATGDGQTFHLIKQDNQWKIQPGSEIVFSPLPSTAPSADGDLAPLEHATAMMRRLADAIRGATREIAGGTLANVNAARQAIADAGVEPAALAG